MKPIPTRTRKRPPRSSGRRASPRKRKAWRLRALASVMLVAFGWMMWAELARHFAPAGNTQLERFDAIVVLGNPADADGNPTPTQLARVTEAVHEYEQGVAPRLIVTGAAVANRFVEAQVMARTAEAQGVPAAAVLVEPLARDTIQNACYAVRIMKAHGWNSAEVISSPIHLARAALIFHALPIEWRAHAAPALQPQSSMNSATTEALETLKTMRYLVWGQWRQQCQL